MNLLDKPLALFYDATRARVPMEDLTSGLSIWKMPSDPSPFRRRAYKASSALRQEVGREVEITVIERDALQEASLHGFLRQVLTDGRTLHGKKLW